MQPNVITLAVDILNNGVAVNQGYTRFEEAAARTIYIGEEHSPASRDTMTLYRTPAKRSGTFLGTTKSAVKFSEDVLVKDAAGNDVAQPVIVEISFSVPVGTPPAKTLELRQRAISMLDNNGVMADLNDRGMI